MGVKIDIYSIIREAAVDLFEAFTVIFFASSAYGDMRLVFKNKLQTGLFMVFYTVVTCFATFYLPDFFNTVLTTIFTAVLISYIMKVNLYSSLIVVVVLFILNHVIEYIVIAVSIPVSGKDMASLINDNGWRMVLAFVMKTLLVCVTLTLPSLKLNFARFNFNNRKNYIYSFVVLQLTMLSIAIIGVNTAITNRINTQYYSVLLIIILVIFVATGMLDLQERNKIAKILSRSEIQEAQIKNMGEIINIIRKERHDYSNHINTIMALCSLNKPDSIDRIRKYMSKLTADVHSSSFRSFDTGNDYIDALLAIKYNYAKENDIDLDILIDEPFGCLPISENEIISIVSNLVDNAFEAVAKSGIENRKVTLKTFFKDDYYCLSVSNNGAPIPKELVAKIFERGFTTKKNDKNEHGFGLYIVKQLVRKNNAELSVASNEQLTVFTIGFKRRDAYVGHCQENSAAKEKT